MPATTWRYPSWSANPWRLLGTGFTEQRSCNQFQVEAKGVTRYGLTYNSIQVSPSPPPTPPEQAAIVRYLDHVDRRIRRYVSAKRKLIALLEEEKRAIVNQAVTRGLDPNVRLKPSGVEWLGDVPEHWEVRRRLSSFSNVDKHTKAAEFPIRLCNYVDVYKNDRITVSYTFDERNGLVGQIGTIPVRTG